MPMCVESQLIIMEPYQTSASRGDHKSDGGGDCMHGIHKHSVVMKRQTRQKFWMNGRGERNVSEEGTVYYSISFYKHPAEEIKRKSMQSIDGRR